MLRDVIANKKVALIGPLIDPKDIPALAKYDAIAWPNLHDVYGLTTMHDVPHLIYLCAGDTKPRFEAGIPFLPKKYHIIRTFTEMEFGGAFPDDTEQTTYLPAFPSPRNPNRGNGWLNTLFGLVGTPFAGFYALAHLFENSPKCIDIYGWDFYASVPGGHDPGHDMARHYQLFRFAITKNINWR